MGIAHLALAILGQNDGAAEIDAGAIGETIFWVEPIQFFEKALGVDGDTAADPHLGALGEETAGELMGADFAAVGKEKGVAGIGPGSGTDAEGRSSLEGEVGSYFALAGVAPKSIDDDDGAHNKSPLLRE